MDYHVILIYDIKSHSTVQRYQCNACIIVDLLCVDYANIVIVKFTKGVTDSKYSLHLFYLLHLNLLRLILVTDQRCEGRCFYSYQNGQIVIINGYAFSNVYPFYMLAFAFLRQGRVLHVKHDLGHRCMVTLENSACELNAACDSTCHWNNTKFCHVKQGKVTCICKHGYSSSTCATSYLCQNGKFTSDCVNSLCRNLYKQNVSHNCICPRHYIAEDNCSKINLKPGQIFSKPVFKNKLYSYLPLSKYVLAFKQFRYLAIFLSKYLILFVPGFDSSILSPSTLTQINFNYNRNFFGNAFASNFPAVNTNMHVTAALIAVDVYNKHIIIYEYKKGVHFLHGFNIELNTFNYTINNFVLKTSKITGLVVITNKTLLSYYKQSRILLDHYYSYICKLERNNKTCLVIHKQCNLNYFIILKYGLDKIVYSKVTRKKAEIVKEEVFAVFNHNVTNLFGKIVYKTKLYTVVNFYTFLKHFFILLKPITLSTKLYKVIYVHNLDDKWFINIESKYYTDIFVQEHQLLVITFTKKVTVIQYNLVAK